MPEDDEPLDPQLERLRLRLLRLLRGGLVLGIGAVVLLVAIVYRFAGASDSAPAPIARMGGEVAIRVPKGAALVGTAVGADRLALTLRLADGRTVIRVVDTAGRPIVTYSLGPADQ